MTEDFNRRVLDALGQVLTDTGAAYWPGWDGEYPTNPPAPPMFPKRLPTATQTAVAVNVYGHESDVGGIFDLHHVRFQVRCRAPDDADPMADKIRTALHGLHHKTVGGVTFERIAHKSLAQLGQDTNGLDERTDNYRAEVRLT